jgi:hypothetical protein
MLLRMILSFGQSKGDLPMLLRPKQKTLVNCAIATLDQSAVRLIMLHRMGGSQ